MEDKLHLYETFIKFTAYVGVRGGLPITKVKKVLTGSFKIHTYSDELMPIVNEVTSDDKDLDFLFDECIRMCDELGPSREYFTLITLFENITSEITRKGNPEAEELSKKVLSRFREEITLINQKIPKPPLFNMLLESRSLVNGRPFMPFILLFQKRIKGEGKPVLLIPPYLGDDYSTSFVRRYLTSLGFKTYKWDQGFNLVKSHYIPKT